MSDVGREETLTNDSDATVEQVVEYCKEKLGAPSEWEIPGGYPDSLASCVLEAVWSLGVHYDRHVRPLLDRYRDLLPTAARDTASDLVAAIDDAGGPTAFAETLRNRQRTSTHKSGILKAEAVYMAAHLLSSQGIETPRELLETVAEDGSALKGKWKEIPGQKSSDTGWRYLLLLAGSQQVKPDRMIKRFVGAALGRTVNEAEAARLLTSAAPLLGVDLRALDHAVWRHQSGRSR